MAEVTEADRAAEAEHEGFTPSCAAWAEYLAGKYDNTAGVQAFASHRQAAELRAARLAEAQIAAWLRANSAEDDNETAILRWAADSIQLGNHNQGTPRDG